MNAIYPERVEESTTQKEEKASRNEGRTWQELNEKDLAIQLCLADEVLDEYCTEKTASSL